VYNNRFIVILGLSTKITHTNSKYRIGNERVNLLGVQLHIVLSRRVDHSNKQLRGHIGKYYYYYWVIVILW
jgi:hypothetical protein